MTDKDRASASGTGLSPEVEPASSLAGSAASIPDAIYHEDAPGTLYAKFVMVGGNLHIRKWSVDRPFDGAALYVNTGNGAPLQEGDSRESYPDKLLPQALRHVAECLWVECEPHVIQDCARIVLAAAQRIEAQRATTGTGVVHEESSHDE